MIEDEGLEVTEVVAEALAESTARMMVSMIDITKGEISRYLLAYMRVFMEAVQMAAKDGFLDEVIKLLGELVEGNDL